MIKYIQYQNINQSSNVLVVFCHAFTKLILIGVLLLAGCTPTPTPTAFLMPPTDVITDTLAPLPTIKPSATNTSTPPTNTPIPKGKTITVTSKDDSGTGSLRQALELLEPYDTILFDPGVFPPAAPETILITSEPLRLNQDHITIDASNAGVILDGSSYPRDTWDACLEIGSDGNVIMGLQVINFTGTGIVVHGNNNIIGGERGIGEGPIGQGNLSSGNSIGIGIWNFAENNTVKGNLLGTDISANAGTGNWGSGVWIVEGGHNNYIGPDNVIAYNRTCGIDVSDPESINNTLSKNSVHNNGVSGICLGAGANAKIGAPFVTEFNIDQGFITGTTCPNCVVEVYSDTEDQGAVFEGQVEANGEGLFTFEKGSAFSNDNVTAITTDADGNSSRFSEAVGPSKGIMTLQDGNSQPKFQLLAKPSRELPPDPRLSWGFGGGNIWSDLEKPQYWLNIANDLGIKRLDTSIQQGEEPIFWERDEFDVFPEYDQFIDGLI